MCPQPCPRNLPRRRGQLCRKPKGHDEGPEADLSTLQGRSSACADELAAPRARVRKTSSAAEMYEAKVKSMVAENAEKGEEERQEEAEIRREAKRRLHAIMDQQIAYRKHRLELAIRQKDTTIAPP